MSREFGENQGTFFHEKLRACMEDLQWESNDEFHKKFIPLFEILYQIGWDISSVEAGDSCKDRSIISVIDNLSHIKKWVEMMEGELEPYKRVMEEAILRHIGGQDED
jgi:hypothetical protein